MKFPSLTKIPKHQRFNFEPRYYDPVKEEIKERTRQIRREVEQSQAEKDDLFKYRSTIARSFSRRSRRNTQANFLQSTFILAFVGTIIGYLYFGNIALYVLLFIIPFYIYLKSRRNND